jgi:hypothetical protein
MPRSHTDHLANGEESADAHAGFAADDTLFRLIACEVFDLDQRPTAPTIL